MRLQVYSVTLVVLSRLSGARRARVSGAPLSLTGVAGTGPAAASGSRR